MEANNESFEMEIVGGASQLTDLSNCDVLVTLSAGTRHVATFFTLANIRLLMDRYRESGECANGLYFWASDMIIVEGLTETAIRQTIRDLLDSGEFHDAFSEAGPLEST
jgi:hypothetical protein